MILFSNSGVMVAGWPAIRGYVRTCPRTFDANHLVIRVGDAISPTCITNFSPQMSAVIHPGVGHPLVIIKYPRFKWIKHNKLQM